MYISRHPKPLTGSAVAQDGVTIPENYAGNAFDLAPNSTIDEDETVQSPATTDEEEATPPPVCEPDFPVTEATEEPVLAPERPPKRSSVSSLFEKLLPRAEHLLSSDALLIFLAVLLAQGDNDSDLSLLLLLLFLF